MPVILATTLDAVQSAYATLSSTPGGGEIHLGPDLEDAELILRGGGPELVTIRSADPEDLVTLSRIKMNDVENVRVTEVAVDSTGVDREDWKSDLDVSGSHGVTFDTMTFSSNADRLYDPADPEAFRGENLGIIEDSSEIVFSGNHISGYFHGLAVLETTGVEVSENEITAMQGDGLRFSGVQDVTVSGNHMYDFHGSVQTANHGDMIQIWARDADLVPDNILISNNILNTGSGSGYQGIYIGNTMLADGETLQTYSDIRVEGNLVYTGSAHGISVYGADGVEIVENTVLWNVDAHIAVSSEYEAEARIPGINLVEVSNATVTSNIAGRYAIEGAEQANNATLDYTSPSSADFVGHHFIGAEKGASAELSDLRLRADSDLIGIGAPASAPALISEDGVQAHVVVAQTSVDLDVLIFDAGFSVDTEGAIEAEDYSFVWTFSDGTEREGLRVAHAFETPGEHTARLEIRDGSTLVAESEQTVFVSGNTFLDLDFSRSLEDGSAYETELNLTGTQAEDGFVIGGTDKIEALADNAHLHDLEAFGLSLDIAFTGEDAGRFIHLHGVLYGTVTSDGQIQIRLDTEAGRFEVDSGDVSVHDGAFHTIAVGYSDQAQALVLSIDGEVVGETTAMGVTAPQGSHGLIIGSNFSPAPDAIVEHVHFGLEPSVAGVEIEGAGFDAQLLSATLVSPTSEEGADPEPQPEPASDPEPEVGEKAVYHSEAEPTTSPLPGLLPEPESASDPEPEPEPAPEVVPEDDGAEPSAPTPASDQVQAYDLADALGGSDGESDGQPASASEDVGQAYESGYDFEDGGTEDGGTEDGGTENGGTENGGDAQPEPTPVPVLDTAADPMGVVLEDVAAGEGEDLGSVLTAATPLAPTVSSGASDVGLGGADGEVPFAVATDDHDLASLGLALPSDRVEAFEISYGLRSDETDRGDGGNPDGDAGDF